jgi:hypothetical protein
MAPIKSKALRSFQVEFRPDEWKFIDPEIVTVEAATAEEAVEKVAPIAGKSLRKQLAAMAKWKRRVCVAEVVVFDLAEGDDAEGKTFSWSI